MKIFPVPGTQRYPNFQNFDGYRGTARADPCYSGQIFKFQKLKEVFFNYIGLHRASPIPIEPSLNRATPIRAEGNRPTPGLNRKISVIGIKRADKIGFKSF